MLLGTVFILRGIPGSGKTYFRTKQFPRALVASADDYFAQGGEFKYDSSKIALAHRFCWRKFHAGMLAESASIVIDNTNVRVADVAAYVLPAEALNYTARVVTFVCDPAIAARRCVHGAPEEYIVRKAEELENETELFPHSWTHEIVKSGEAR
ncbi:MAG: AAA family ATPase [bacterium]